MDFERALETQRMKLLRLLARWAFTLGLLSAGPLALPVPRWARAFVETLVIRAEYAAQYLVQVSGFLQSTNGLADPTIAPRPRCTDADDVPSVQALIRRIAALRDLLENLPRHTRRLLRVRIIAREAFDWSKRSDVMQTRDRLVADSPDWIAPRVERPPDKWTLFSRFILNSPCFAGGRRSRLFGLTFPQLTGAV